MKILLAVDGSPSSAAAVSETARIRWDAGTEIRVISVVETPVVYSAGLEGVAAPSYEEMEKNEMARAHEAIERAVATLRGPGADRELNIATDILSGSPKRIIVEEAERTGADLIVVGSHGYRGWERLLLGSVSQAVAQHANCSVLIVREPKA